MRTSALWCLSFLTAIAPCVRASVSIAPGVELIPGVTNANSQPDGNSVVMAGRDGLIVFDTGRHLPHTRQIIALAQARQRPIVAIINSHWHLDHVGGNVLLRQTYPDIQVYASSAMDQALGGFLADYRKQLIAALDQAPADSPSRDSLTAEVALIDAGPQLAATRVIGKSQTMRVGGRKLEVHLERSAVTAGDVWVFDPETRVLLAGDLVTLPAPFMDTACPTRWRDSLSHLAARHFRVLIPGHGLPMPPAGLETYQKAFSGLLTCGATDRPKGDCVNGWIRDAGELIPEPDRGYARALADYYVDNVLRGDPGRLARLCARP